jgi:hypothetical protein
VAVFKTLNAKKKEYAFDFLDNRKDPRPAKVVFRRFPLPGENFAPGPPAGAFDGIDMAALAARDRGELEKLSRALARHMSASASRVDHAAFMRECADGFLDFRFVDENGVATEVRTVDDFLGINRQVMAAIAHDCYTYASREDEFSMGE